MLSEIRALKIMFIEVIKLNSKMVSDLPSFEPYFIFHFHHLPSPVLPTGFSFCFFPGFFHFFIVIEQRQTSISQDEGYKHGNHVCNMNRGEPSN